MPEKKDSFRCPYCEANINHNNVQHVKMPYGIVYACPQCQKFLYHAK